MMARWEKNIFVLIYNALSMSRASRGERWVLA